MQIDSGLAVVILAVLIFYLRLIVLQRERARRVRLAAVSAPKSGLHKARDMVEPAKFGLLSPRRSDRIIGAAGIAAILIGVVLNSGLMAWPAGESAWWIPTAVGIMALSAAFRV